MIPLYKNIRNRRLELGMSQDELAEKVGYSDRTSIAKIEAGKVDIPQSKILAFAAALFTTGPELMGWDGEKPIPSSEDELSPEEHELVKKYRLASKEIKGAINRIVGDG